MPILKSSDIFWAIWNGVVKTKEEIKAEYGVDEVEYDVDMMNVLNRITNGGQKVLYTVAPNVVPGMTQVVLFPLFY